MKPHSKLSAVTSNGTIYIYTLYADPALDTDAIFKWKPAICYKET